MRFRVLTTLAVLVAALGVLAIGVSSAAASTKSNESGYNYLTDPQTTNIPWLAWAGETVKVSRCFGLGDGQITETAFNNSSYNHGSPIIGEFDKADWSGATDQPPFFQTGTGDQTSRQVQPTWDANGGVCFSTDVTSEKAGLERIKFSLSTDLGKFLNFFLGQDIVFQQDLYVIWMWDTAPALTESGDVGAYQVGDPNGSGSFSPIADASGHYSFQPGLIKVQVKGSFPFGNDYATYPRTDAMGSATLDSAGNIVLPDSWPYLAGLLAEDFTSASTYPGATPYRWDIHDDQTNIEGHTQYSGCSTLVDLTLTQDAVDTCNGVSGDPDLGPFSSIFGLVGVNNDAIGPFDPIRPFETLLSDGNLNADDAPMPALRVDVALTNANTDHSVGTLSKADKSLIFNRNDAMYGGNDGTSAGSMPLTDPHVMYAPFYKAYIPAVTPLLDLNTTSGVEGSIGGNYGNWLSWGAYGNDTSQQSWGTYDYWDTYTLDRVTATNDCYDVQGNYIETPGYDEPGTGDQVAVYTDEHGQAYVQFNPANANGEGIVLTPDSNGRCDVYTGSLVGTATIQAESVYPAQQPSDPSNAGAAKLSNTLTKTVNFTPSKVLTCIPKGTNEAYCVETVTDFEGNPVAADVEFTLQAVNGSQPKSWGPDFAKVGGYDASGQKVLEWNTDYIDLTTDPATGQAAIYVHSSTNQCIDVTVENLGTQNYGAGITRDFDFNPTSGTVCSTGGSNNSGSGGSGGSGGTGGSDSSTGGSSNSSSTSPNVVATPVAVTAPAPTAQATQAPAAKPAKVAKPAKLAKMTLVSARIIKVNKARFLTVRVNSTAKMARLHITLIMKNGKVLHRTRFVPTNHVVRVKNLRLAPSVKMVRVAVV